MSFNYGREEKKWRLWKEAEEKQLRSLGVNEDTIEQLHTRPVLVISNNTGNRYSPTIIIAPITSRTHTKAKLPTHTEVKDCDKLDKDSIILLEQIRTIDKQRLKQYMGMMPDSIMARVDKALVISLSLADK